MNDQEKQTYLEKYHQAKEKGVPFFPDIIFKDALVSLLIFVILIALAYFKGAPLEARADPADANYTPRPEWYFLFLFQLLKYFPGNLEVIGVVLLPTLAIILLFLLPLLDRSPRRHFLGRPVISGVTTLAVAGIVFLTVQAMREAPPPVESGQGDEVAALYAKNCAGCHGAEIEVSPGTNLHQIITQGQHEGMPAWSADLTTDEVDALAGFIVSPGGNQLFQANCGNCHEITDLVAGDPLELKTALERGLEYPPHKGTGIPDWAETLNQEERTSLLNFLVAPDGQRLFSTNCSPCHGRAVSYSGDQEELRDLISKGGKHLEMPPWQEKLLYSELDSLAKYVVDPTSMPDGKATFEQYCTDCHGDRVPAAESVEQAREIIATGGAHETMPVWGDILTSEQLSALVEYTLDTAQGSPLEVGRELFNTNCTSCHGKFGEGGPNPTRAGDIIAPIGTAEFLKTRDDVTLRNIISQGQPNFGMSPFGSANGGPLEDSEIDAIITFLRSWQDNPPVELLPEVSIPSDVALDGNEIFAALCKQCHNPRDGQRVAPDLGNRIFQIAHTDKYIFDAINQGHQATPMIAWGEILTADQIQQLVDYIRLLPPEDIGAPGVPSFQADILPIFLSKCKQCHGHEGGWDSTSYAAAMSSGDHAPVVLAGDIENSLLAQKIQGAQPFGDPMPTKSKLRDYQVQLILDWIAAGAPDN